jgi:hypothetical protein
MEQNLILNEPAGKIGRTVVQHTVGLVVKAWDNPSENVHAIAEDILQCLYVVLSVTDGHKVC